MNTENLGRAMSASAMCWRWQGEDMYLVEAVFVAGEGMGQGVDVDDLVAIAQVADADHFQGGAGKGSEPSHRDPER